MGGAAPPAREAGGKGARRDPGPVACAPARGRGAHEAGPARTAVTRASSASRASATAARIAQTRRRCGAARAQARSVSSRMISSCSGVIPSPRLSGSGQSGSAVSPYRATVQG
jgi:hypothetical protein